MVSNKLTHTSSLFDLNKLIHNALYPIQKQVLVYLVRNPRIGENAIKHYLCPKVVIMAKEEIFPLVDEAGNLVGSATRKECHSGSMLLHPVVHLHIFNSKGELFLQKRSSLKDIQPGKWDTAVGGHIDLGENVDMALRREAREELGIQEFDPTFNYTYLWESSVERELVYSYRTVYEGPFQIDPVELDEGRFWPMEEIEKRMEDDIFTGNFKKEFAMLKELDLK